jgi:hypothetical protein
VKRLQMVNPNISQISAVNREQSGPPVLHKYANPTELLCRKDGFVQRAE